ncbi:MAG: Uncharacterized protein FD134_1216 [Gallionellaceae bacterium]|nr:MAG: Uncharacterized protein FD134_1216 [Gallionellaceae bacterium]
MLIDWLTIRYPLDETIGKFVFQKVSECLGRTYCMGADGEVKWIKNNLDLDKLRSDSQGLYGDSRRYLTVGASPASLEFAGLNVFGSADIEYCAQVLIKHVACALSAVLPSFERWQCRRIDVTCNYDMGNPAQVKQALRLLLGTDAPRRRTNSDRKGGDTVYWNPSSDLRAGKAYHKGAHLRRQVASGAFECPGEFIEKADNLLRLELKLGARWLRRLQDVKAWHQLTEMELVAEHRDFFGALIGQGLEVKDMGALLQELEKICPTKGKALAAHRTWLLIRSVGYTQAKESMGKTAWYDHTKYLRAAGLSSAELCAGQIVELRTRRLIVAEPVSWWDDIKKVA